MILLPLREKVSAQPTDEGSHGADTAIKTLGHVGETPCLLEKR
jgi:hypothetical protein